MSHRIEDRLMQLSALPELEPPAALEDKTLAAMAAASDDRHATQSARAFARAAVWIAVIGAGLILTLVTLNTRPLDDDAVAAAEAEASYRVLSEQSARLEQVLAELPQRRVMRGSTAGTIVGLEDRIAMIDAELARARDSSEKPQYRAALMQDRVDVMSALVNVRYTQSPAFGY